MNKSDLTKKLTDIYIESEGNFFDKTADWIEANFTPKGGQESVEKAATNYANSHWDILNNPNEHDNAFSDFKAGAQWALANTPKGEAEKVTAKECYLVMIGSVEYEDDSFEKIAELAHEAHRAFNKFKTE